MYNTSIPLAPGTYRLDIAAKDVVGGNLAHYQAALNVPRLDPERLQTSGILLADLIEKAPLRSIGAGQFVIGDSKVRPRLDARFQRSEKLGVYCKVYHVGAAGQVEYEIVRAGTEERVYGDAQGLAVGAGRTEVTIERFVDLAGFVPGQYVLRLRIAGGGQRVTSSAAFAVL